MITILFAQMFISRISQDVRMTRLIVFVFTVVLYAPSLTYEFTQDDAIVIYDNVFVQQGWSGLSDIFTTDSFTGFFSGEQKSDLVTGGRYRPLSLAIFALIYDVVGSTPWIFHLMSVMSYGLLCLLLYQALISIQVSWPRESQLLFALICTLIYAAHPIHTEVVANIKGMDEILSFLFSLVAFLASLRFIKTKSIFAFIGVGISLFLALLSKESAAPMVLLIPVFAFFLGGREKPKLSSSVIVGLLSITVFAAYFFIRSSIVGGGLGDTPDELLNNPFIKVVDGSYLAFTSEEKWATILYGLGKYLQLLFFPHPLTHDYYPRHIGILDFSELSVWLSGIMHVVLLAIAGVGLRRRSMISLMILFYFATIFLTSNVLFPIGTHLSERFLFVPSLAIAAVASLGLLQLYKSSRRAAYTLPAIVLLLLLMTGKTMTRSAVWKDDFTLFTTDVHTSPGSAKIRNAAAGTLLERSGEDHISAERSEEMIRAAIGHLDEALRIHPRYKEAAMQTANAYSYIEEYDSAIRFYNYALELDPSYDVAFSNLLQALTAAAQQAGSKDRDFEKAKRYLSQVLSHQPDNFDALSLMGTAYGSAGQHNEAITYYKRAITVNPDIALTYVNLGLAQINKGLEEEAQENFQKAVAINPRALDKIRK